MDVLLYGASGRIGQRIAIELLERGHRVTGVSRTGEFDEIDEQGFEAVSGDAADADDVARLAEGRDAVGSAIGPADGEDVTVLPETAAALLEGLRRSGVARLVWTGGAGSLQVGPGTRLVETDEFPEGLTALAQAHIEALDVIRDAADIEWSYLAPPARIEPGERTGTYRTADGFLVADDDGESRISMEDFAVAFADEIERGDAIHTQLGVGY